MVKDALRIAELEKLLAEANSELLHGREELSVINSVQEALVQAYDLQAIYDLVGERIRELFDAQAVIISTFDHEADLEVFCYAIENGERFYPESRPINKLRKHLIDTHQKIIINTLIEAQEWFGTEVVPGTKFMQSGVFVPLVSGGTVTGYVSLQNVEREHAFSAYEIRLLETLSNSMSSALQNARLLKETEQRTAELAVINSVQEGLAKELDIQAIYDLVGNRIRELFDAQVVGIATIDYEKQIEHIHFLIEKNERYYPVPRPLNTLRKHMIETKEKVLINSNFEAVALAFGMKQVPGTEPPKSALYVPLINGEKVTGYVSLQNIDRENAFSEGDVRLLETLANTMGVSLENARLFDQTTRLLKETEQQKAELGVINSVQEGLAKELDMQAIYDLVGDRIRQLFNAQAVIIATFDHDTAIEHFKYIIEDGQRFYLATRPYDKLRQHLIINKQKIVINTKYSEAYAKFGLRTLPGTNVTKSGVFVPLIIGDKVNSYISLQNNETENAFSENDVRLLETLANSMSVALENARLFDETTRLLKETEQRTAELAVINSVQEGLAKELDMQGIYDLVGERVQKLFNAQAVIIGTLDLNNLMEYFNYVFENNELVRLEPRKFTRLREILIERKQSIYISSESQAVKEYGISAVGDTQMPKSLLFVPLMAGNLIRGYVSLQNIDQENAFSPSDIRLLETLANSMSVALENARLFDETNRLLKETEQRTAELAVINSVQEGLARELDIKGIYNLVGDRICDVFPDTNALVIRTFDYDLHQEYFQYAIEKGTKLTVDPRPFLWANRILIESKKPLNITENFVQTSMAHGGKGVTTGQPPKSAVFVPMLVGDVVKGSISLQHVEKEHAFSEADVRLLTTIANSMSVALENARLFDETNRLLKETKQRTAELAVINSVQEGLAKELDMQGIYELVGDRLCSLFPDTQTLVIRTFDHESKEEHWQYSMEKGERQYVDPRPFNWNSKLLIETHKPLDIRRNYVEESIKNGGTGVTTGQPPKSAVFVPMLVGDVVKGSVSLQNVDKENAFTESDLRLLTTITNSMSVALENARLFDETALLLKETEQRTAELAVINSVQEGLSRELDIKGIYNIVGDRLCYLFPDTNALVIRTYDHEKVIEHFQYAIEKGEKFVVDPRPIMWASKILIESKKPYNISENFEKIALANGSKPFTSGQPPKSAVFVPMIVGDIVKGSISLQNIDREHAFSDADVRLLTTIANSMSVALENARLFGETTMLLADSKQRAAELVTVNNISKALASQLDPADLINMVGDQLKDLFNANIVYLAMLNKKTGIVNFPYQYGDIIKPLKLGEGLTSKIITTGQPLLINKDMNEQRAQMGVQKIGIDAASYLGVPIPVGDENIGVLSVQSTEHENRFNENDLRLLTTIASSVGVALRNATLFEEVKKAQLEAEEASKAAELANEAKSAFLSTVSHELRTPLTSVLGFAKIIRKRLEERIFPAVELSDTKTEKAMHQVTENLKVVISEGERLTHLINDVLDLAKIEAGKMEWNREDVSIPEIVDRAISATTALFVQKPIVLEKNIEDPLPEIVGDRDKLIQVVINLISNAIKFTEKGKVTCNARLKGDAIVVSIKDTGIGISKVDYGAVFEQFKQVGGDTLTDKPKGTGLGLPICKEIVEHHGGTIWLESEQGKGSTFFFSLPVKTKNKTGKPVELNHLVQQLKAHVAGTKANRDGKPAHILIVDDDESIRSLLRQELSEAGYQISEAVNGIEALEKVRTNRPHLVILDIMMPEMNGFDVAAILKNDPETMDIPILVLSVVQDKARGVRIGVDRYLTKPIDTVLLFNEIGSLLEQGNSRKKVMIANGHLEEEQPLKSLLFEKGYDVVEVSESELADQAKTHLPDIIMIHSELSAKQDFLESLRFEKGLENVFFVVYQ